MTTIEESKSTNPVYAVLGDLGGTKVRFWLMKAVDAKSGAYEIEANEAFKSASFGCMTEAVIEFLQHCGIIKSKLISAEDRNGSKFPSVLCVCVAGPVDNQVADITNLAWKTVSGPVLRESLGISQVYVMNDFVGVGYGLLGVKPDQLTHINPSVKPVHGAPIAVLGPGTGLGEAYLTHNGKHYDVWPAEGGHCAFAPSNAQDFQMIEYIKKTKNTTRCSVERVASGSGMANIYSFLSSIRQTEDELTRRVLSSESPAAMINEQALKGTDPLSVEAMEVFVRSLGNEAGSLALKTLPFGGLYVAGGMAPKVLWALQQYKFHDYMLNQGRLRSALERVPVFIVTIEELGLVGCAVVALRLINNQTETTTK